MNDKGLRRLKGDRWEIRISTLDGRTGKKTDTKRVFEGTLTEARRARAELLAEVRATGSVRRERTRLSDYAASWLEQRADQLKPSVVRKYGTSLTLHVLPALGDLYLDAIGPADVRTYVSDRLKVAQGATALNELRLLRTIARDSVADGHCAAYWCDRVRAPEVRAHDEDRPNMLTAAQLARVLTAVPKTHYALVLLIATTGLRWGEASALRWEDLDLAAGVVRVRRGNWKGRAVDTKTKGSRRAVALLPEVARALGTPPPEGGLLFPTQAGQMHRGSPLAKVLTRACVAAGLAQWVPGETPKEARANRRALRTTGLRITPHGLRRTFNNLARQHTSGQVLRSITGHATEAMTDHYSLVGISEKATVQRLVAAAAGVAATTDGDA